MRRALGLLLAATSVVPLASTDMRQAARSQRAVPIDAIDGILEAFRSHPIVMLGHAHGNLEKHAFQLALLHDPRFAATVNDIVEECGSSRYQDLMDRYIGGDDVPFSAVRQILWNTVNVNTNCDRPMYEEFFRAVREVNASLPKDRRVRVLLGDPPIDWDQVRTFHDVLKWGDERDTHPASVIRREVLAKGRRALVVYGEMHAQRRNERVNYENADYLAGLLESDGVTRVFTIWPTLGSRKPDISTLQPDVSSWPRPSLARVRGTILGAADFSSYFTSDGRLQVVNGKPVPIPREQWRPMRMEDQFDAILYLGPPSAGTYQQLAPERCVDREYMEMRMRRMSLLPDGTAQIARLKEYCASHARN